MGFHGEFFFYFVNDNFFIIENHLLLGVLFLFVYTFSHALKIVCCSDTRPKNEPEEVHAKEMVE